MARTPKDITDAELAVLDQLWEQGESTVRDIAIELYPEVGSSDLATVQKLCERLEQKGFVTRERQRRPQRFRAALERHDLLGRQLRNVAERFCSGSYAPLVTHLLRGAALSEQEIRTLREQVEELSQSPRAGHRPARRRE